MSAVDVKVCGITRIEDALAVIDLGAALLGLNFYKPSPRCITVDRAQEIAAAMGKKVKLVGVFVNMNVLDVMRIADLVGLDAVQLHGDESPDDCETIAREFEVIRALKVDEGFGADRVAQFSHCSGVLFDTQCSGHGGSGKSFDWTSVQWTNVRRAIPKARIFLAGGLEARNVAEAIEMAQPDVVDVCSGVESAKGIKSVSKVREFMAAVRAVERHER